MLRLGLVPVPRYDPSCPMNGRCLSVCLSFAKGLFPDCACMVRSTIPPIALGKLLMLPPFMRTGFAFVVIGQDTNYPTFFYISCFQTEALNPDECERGIL